jgi:hypothetical protein
VVFRGLARTSELSVEGAALVSKGATEVFPVDSWATFREKRQNGAVPPKRIKEKAPAANASNFLASAE